MTHLNLLPIKRRRRQLLKRRLWQWAVVVSCFVAAGIGLALGALETNRQAKQRATALRRQYAPTRAMQNEIDDIRKRMKNLEAQKQLAIELGKRKSVVSLLGILSRATKTRTDRISIQNLVLTRSRVDGEDGPSISRTLELKGVALNSGDISVISSYLEDANAFHSVHLDSSSITNVGGFEAQGYVLRCEY